MAAQPTENGGGGGADVAQWKSLDMTGRTVLVTGGSDGIGKATAMDLARRKARVIIACRNQTKGKAVVDEIVTATGNQNVLVKPLDLCSFKSVRTLAEDILKTEPKLYALVNNAGAFFEQRVLTEDHVESTFSTNYLGHFLLTLLLLPLLKKSGSSRIVLVSSMLYLAGHIDFENLNGEKSYKKGAMYNNSKVAIMLFGRELSHRLKDTSVNVYMCSPGMVRSNMTVTYSGFLVRLHKILPRLFQTPEQGANTTVYAISCADIGQDSGQFYANCKKRSLAPHVCNDLVVRKLWSISEKLCGTAYE